MEAGTWVEEASLKIAGTLHTESNIMPPAPLATGVELTTLRLTCFDMIFHAAGPLQPLMQALVSLILCLCQVPWSWP